MAGAVDKYAGAVVGMHHGFTGDSAPQRSAFEVASTASCEERLVVGDNILTASLDAEGSIVWSECRDTLKTKEAIVQQSQMASMLRDTYRNNAYSAALERRIGELTATLGRPPRVLDVGAGTGLLSLLSSRAGAACVHGIEQWDMMASIAEQVTRLAPIGCSITIHHAHSTSLTPSQHFDGALFDLVVSEILDSALLGEGMLPAMKDVHARLLTDTASDIPVRATVYAQIVQSTAASCWQDCESCVLRPGLSMAARASCQALHASIPVHASQLLQSGDLRLLSEPVASLTIEFGRANPMISSATGAAQGQSIEEKVHAAVPALPGGHLGSLHAPAGTSHANAVLWWWEVTLHEGDADKGQHPITYSTHWESASTGAQGWQDHWTQCLQPLPTPVLPSGGTFTLAACHNESRVWFYAGPGGARVWPSKRAHKMAEKRLKAETSDEARAELAALTSSASPGHVYLEPQPCICGLHSCLSVDRRWALSAACSTSGGATGMGRVDALRVSLDALVKYVAALKKEEARELLSVLGDDAQDPEPEHALRLRMMDLSEGGLASLLALTSSTAGACMSAFVAQYPPVVATPERRPSPAQVQASAARLLATDTEEAEGVDEQAPDPLLLHMQNLVSSLQSDGLLSPQSALMPVPAPGHMCSPQYLAHIEQQYMEGCDDEDEDQDDQDQDNLQEDKARSSVQLDMLCGEPFYQSMSSSQLWTASAWWARVQGVKTVGNGASCASPSFVTPSAFTIYAQPVTFSHLHTSFAPPDGPVNGFDHGPFIDIQSGYHAHTFNLPLWQYQYNPTQAAVALLTVDVRYSLPVPGESWPSWHEQVRFGASSGSSPAMERAQHDITCGGVATAISQESLTANAVIYWVEYSLQPVDVHGQAGPVPLPTDHTQWPKLTGAAEPVGQPNPYRQAVRFIPLEQVGKFHKLEMRVEFNSRSGLFEPSVHAS